jgi:hypothetical protein
MPLRRAVPTVLALAAAATAATLVLARSATPDSEPRFDLGFSDPGVYAVSWEALRDAAPNAPPLPRTLESARLEMTWRGEPVPIRVDDGGDGRFGPGDRIELVVERLPGEGGWFNEHTDLNVYRLGLAVDGAPAPPRMRDLPPPGGAAAKRPALTARHHLEREQLFLRFPDEDRVSSDVWYWARLSALDAEPLRVPLGIAGLDRRSAAPVEVTVGLRGWSHLGPAFGAAGSAGRPHDHRVEAALGGLPPVAAEWDDAGGGFRLELPPVAPSALPAGEAALELRVAARPGADGGPLVDAVLLDWVEVVYPRLPDIDGEPARHALAAGTAAPAAMTLWAPGADGLTVFGDGGSRAPAAPAAGGGWTVSTDGLGAGFWAVPAGALRAPVSIERDLPSTLRSTERQADYLILAHPRLLGAIQPLAAFHRARGLEVEVVSVTDVYDEFSHGIADPRAIRAFVSYAYHRWRRPAPRFVLLVGDASWDVHHRGAQPRRYVDWAFDPAHGGRFARNRTVAYAERPRFNHRNLIPSWSYPTAQGHAATDNWFVAVDGDDRLPDLAIGRLPVTDPEEVAAIVAKTLRHVRASGVGPWRRELVWLRDDTGVSAWTTSTLAGRLAARGFAAIEVTPAPAGGDLDEHRRRLVEALADGPRAVHFVGHGGRFIWRTAPPDLDSQDDLFNHDELDRLPPAPRLPIVVSLTCYSAPFDHPNADSIGEKFLRLPDRGAVAVVAASWRNAPIFAMSERLMDQLTRPGTVGEALMRAKRASDYRDFIEQYNLLGDPALPLAVPERRVAVRRLAAFGDGPAVEATLDASRFSGRARVDWVDAAGAPVARRDLEAGSPRIVAPFPGGAAAARRVAAVEVYMWDPVSGIDGLGAVVVGGEAAVSPGTAGGSGRRIEAADRGAIARPDGPSEREELGRDREAETG